MTKVQRHFQLARPLDEALMDQIPGVNALYGIERIVISPSRDSLMIEFDATRLRVNDVEMALERAGIPVSDPVSPV
jgi:hypothetical protein